MKARHIAPSTTRVYVIDPDNEIRSIERGTDGLWGPWQDTGVRAKHLVHGGSVIASIDGPSPL